MLSDLSILNRFIPKGEFKSATWECLNVEEDGQVTATDYTVTMSMNIPELKGITANIPAEKLKLALGACGGSPTFSISGDVLTVKEGKFKAEIKLVVAPYPTIPTPGEEVPCPGGMVKALKAMQPFMATSNKRPILQSLYLSNGFAYATDGQVAAKIPAPTVEGLSLLLPPRLVDELIKNEADPVKVRLSENRATFFYSELNWIQSNVLEGRFPNVDKVLSGANIQEAPEIDGAVKDGVSKVLRFATGDYSSVTFDDNGIKAGEAIFYMDGLKTSYWNGKTLANVLAVATHADLEAYPNPAGWRGEDGIEGVLLGLAQGEAR